MNLEIARLRSEEASMQAASEEVDRISRDLMNTFACTWVTADAIPYGHWAKLPWDWARGISIPIVPVQGIPPRDLRGPVAVSCATLKWIAEQR